MDEKDTGRLEAFSDGVFAVAITLLILDVKIDAVDVHGLYLGDSALWTEIVGEFPKLIAFVTSFLTIGIMWLNHHALFRLIKRSDALLLFINLVLLMIIVFIPVPTALLASYITQQQFHGAALLYSSVCFIMSCCFNILWRYASYKGRLLAHNANKYHVEGISRQYLLGPLFYVIAFGLAWFNTLACAFFCCGLAIFFAFPNAASSILLKGKGVLNAKFHRSVTEVSQKSE